MSMNHKRRKLKKKLQRGFSAAICALLAFTFIVLPIMLEMSSFEDIDYSTPTGEAVSVLTEQEVIKGITETEFGPDELVTRQQMAAFIYRLMNGGKSAEGGENLTPFIDLEDSTYFLVISWASQEGVIKGRTETMFDPEGSITLKDAYTMLCRALGHKDLMYPDEYIEKAEKELCLNENLDESLAYEDALTRGEVAVLLYNTYENKKSITPPKCFGT